MTDHKKAWWFDSHTSAKRSPWLQSTLSEIEEKTKEMLNLIEEDADSFAQRAEMYYRKRPELISMIQDFYRSYRFLAEQHELLKSDTGTRNSTCLNSYFSNQSCSQKLWDSIDSLNYSDSDVSEVDDPEPEEEAKEAIEFKLARAEGHSSLSPLVSKLSPVTGTSIQTAVNLLEEPFSNGCNNNAVSFLPISALDILDSKNCDNPDYKIKGGGLARVDQLKFETPYENIVSDVMRQRSEVERLKMEKKAMETELEKKDEEKRDVIRQLSLAVEILKEENGNLKRLIRCSSRSSSILGLKKLKDAFSVNGRLFGFPSRFQSSLVAL